MISVNKEIFESEYFFDEYAPMFLTLLKSKWDEIHREQNVFRYRIDNLKGRVVDGKYLLQVNTRYNGRQVGTRYKYLPT